MNTSSVMAATSPIATRSLPRRHWLPVSVGSVHDTAAAEIRQTANRSIGSSATVDAIIDELLARHAEPHRRYHTAEHVMWVLRHIDRLCAGDPGSDVDRQAIDVAALFHDVIYDPRSVTNEADSAVLATAWLDATGWPNQRIARVERMIIATADHDASDDAEAILLDADLAILGASRDDYDSYVRAVRFEYSFIDDDQWRVGRADVLAKFIDRERIFATTTMAGEREQQARINLTCELAALRSTQR